MTNRENMNFILNRFVYDTVGIAEDIYCRSGRRSAIAVEAMKKLGYTDLTDLGGMDEAKKRLRK